MTVKRERNKRNGDTQSTGDINLATYIKVIKGIDSCGHHFEGRQLLLRFPLTKDQIGQIREEYINSVFSVYDATRRNYWQLTK
jgi:hypothetical protein